MQRQTALHSHYAKTTKFRPTNTISNKTDEEKKRIEMRKATGPVQIWRRFKEKRRLHNVKREHAVAI